MSGFLYEYKIETNKEGFHDITQYVSQAISRSGINEGICVIFCPHTTAGITINENADPDVKTDMLYGLNKAYPDRIEFNHSEGNSAAHLKASAAGSSATVIVNNGKPLLGMWQNIYFCEFDGPRSRRFYIKIIEG